MSSRKTLFKEVQHLQKWIVYLVTVILLLVLSYMYYHTYEMKLKETSILGLSTEYKLMLAADIIGTIIILGLLFIIWTYKMVIKVSHRSFYYKFPPVKPNYKKIHTHRFLEVKRATTDDLPRGTVKIRMKGKEGVFMDLEDDKRVFVGSQHPDKLEQAIKRMLEAEP
jgi:hypothetical protein